MSSTYEVKITKQALEQMEEIVSYISEELCAPDAARNLLMILEERISELSSMPKRAALIEEEPWKSQGIRKIIVNNFLVYFWIDEIHEKVQVIAVIYHKMDQAEQLNKLRLM